MTKQEAQEITHALMVVNDAREAVKHARQRDVIEALDELEQSLSRLNPAPGVSVARAAQWLGVSEPTVRNWITRGILEQIEGQSPIQVGPDGLQHVNRAIAELRSRGQDRDWLKSLADYMQDEAARRSPTMREGLEQFRSGKLEPV